MSGEGKEGGEGGGGKKNEVGALTSSVAARPSRVSLFSLLLTTHYTLKLGRLSVFLN